MIDRTFNQSVTNVLKVAHDQQLTEVYGVSSQTVAFITL